KPAAVAVIADSTVQIKESLSTLENENLKITLSNYGAKLVRVELKNYKSYKNYTQGKNAGIVLFDANKDVFDVEIPTSGKKLALSKLVYQAQANSNQVIFTSQLPNGKKISQTYRLPSSGYELSYSVDAKEISSELTGNEYFIHWKENVTQTEKDAQEERKATINYLLTEDEEFDNLSENPSSVSNENLSQSIQWLSFKKKYFLAGLVPQGTLFTKANLTATPNTTDSINIKTLDAQLVAPMGDLSTGKSNFKFYFGPNDYSIVKNIAPAFGKNVKLSYDFLLPITKYIFVPLFGFLESIISNYGLLIILLVLIIKTALLPLTYKSYISMAKTRILAPEIAAIKEKIGDDPARVQQETMKLYGEVGVNPLSGCIPVLATMPILMAVFMLFPNLINLRQESFLWAEDLSTYDSILNLPFNIPFYGSHIS
ncbi:MAG: membrane protein insertase YidC, partial [Aquirufa sp.]